MHVYTDSSHHVFQVEIADTYHKITRGLMFRKSLEPMSGMLFIGTKERVWRMWMKNTYIPLDMLFFNRHGIIIKIIQNTTPLDETVLSSDIPVAGVVEISGGEVDRLGIHVGDKIVSDRLGNY